MQEKKGQIHAKLLRVAETSKWRDVESPRKGGA